MLDSSSYNISYYIIYHIKVSHKVLDGGEVKKVVILIKDN